VRAWACWWCRTWAATLLQSSNVAYKYGVSGPFWYAAGATIQIILFGILAIEVKRKAPTAHTVLEIISAPRARPVCPPAGRAQQATRSPRASRTSVHARPRRCPAAAQTRGGAARRTSCSSSSAS